MDVSSMVWIELDADDGVYIGRCEWAWRPGQRQLPLATTEHTLTRPPRTTTHVPRKIAQDPVNNTTAGARHTTAMIMTLVPCTER